MSVQDIIDEVIADKEEHISSGKYSPSLFGACYRRQHLKRSKFPPTNPPDKITLRKFKAGNLFHDFVQGIVLSKYPEIQKEVKIETDNVLGFADMVDVDEVADIKSQHSKKFWWNIKEFKAGKDIKDMFFNNWMQVMWYAWQLNKSSSRIIFVSKDDLAIQEYVLPVDDYWKGMLDEELTKLEYYWKEKVIPPAQPRLYDGKECSWCVFSEHCWGKQTEAKKESK